MESNCDCSYRSSSPVYIITAYNINIVKGLVKYLKINSTETIVLLPVTCFQFFNNKKSRRQKYNLKFLAIQDHPI